MKLSNRTIGFVVGFLITLALVLMAAEAVGLL